jgi:hypothetical protein
MCKSSRTDAARITVSDLPRACGLHKDSLAVAPSSRAGFDVGQDQVRQQSFAQDLPYGGVNTSSWSTPSPPRLELRVRRRGSCRVP